MPTRAGIAAALLVSCALASVTLMSSRLEAAMFLGKVVDAKTGEPLEGAVVVVIWSRYPDRPQMEGGSLPYMEGGSLPYKADEQLTDPHGEFSVDVSPGEISSKFHSRQVVIFKPGYQPLENLTDDEQAPLFAQPGVGLTKVRTVKKARRYRGASDLHVDVCRSPDPREGCVPQAWVPHLIRILEIQARLYEAYPAGHFIVEEDR